MKYILHINQEQAIKLGMTNTSQAIIFDLLSTASTWAEPVIYENKVYYWVARQVIVKELPLLHLKEDTVYRHLKELDKIDLIVYIKVGKKDCINITKKGRKYISNTISEINPNNYVGNKSENNSEINPNNYVGNKSEKNSDLNPTYQYTIPYPKEEEEYLKYIKNILSDDTRYEVFSIEFYDFIYPKNKKSNQQKIWYGNKIKENILEKEKQTIENISKFVEFQNQLNFKLQNHKGRENEI